MALNEANNNKPKAAYAKIEWTDWIVSYIPNFLKVNYKYRKLKNLLLKKMNKRF
jgi:hypothetical protein